MLHTSGWWWICEHWERLWGEWQGALGRKCWDLALSRDQMRWLSPTLQRTVPEKKYNNYLLAPDGNLLRNSEITVPEKKSGFIRLVFIICYYTVLQYLPIYRAFSIPPIRTVNRGLHKKVCFCETWISLFRITSWGSFTKFVEFKVIGGEQVFNVFCSDRD